METCSKLALKKIITFLDTSSVLALQQTCQRFHDLLQYSIVSFPPKGHFIDYTPDTHVYLLYPKINRVDIKYQHLWKHLTEISHHMINYENLFISKKTQGFKNINLINQLISQISCIMKHRNIKTYQLLFQDLPYLHLPFQATLNIYGRPDHHFNIIIDVCYQSIQQNRIACQVDHLPDSLSYLSKKIIQEMTKLL